ncbi:hypothetical protein E6P09_04975 [Haloferax mediterranei ATCC 33500]|uniref:Uncharacterized protein n=1 Tax=Haloferax mediterranei (strain ATCC 33500 / DSM 1411 / JCM 8866 / NBRC 14739 / NCIMB 2177 / R-4) TaxID=523841 RepID=I3R1K6_HALMT|nr:hypothetical protein [Haloferax mediterranei]AFK18116.1 hypothetical protein HFX_0380 [Haloferax mediterranei ATCC 33500]AHZ22476.1 hypothetical protein BM92_07360 [Haloferax mediterranei ATCC 33500]EMA02611.1 hypothetical protein C439_08510 [Haloferax mediterranei ATCC 33500]MDX5988206.1 hypothetical protein [Haloferax mediterranei ATCC 33500]QCQ74649.1 hypothetical protein E6P09_04975 [Haloferax mediterranei ATCC 33500]
MGLGILDMVGLGATLIFALPVGIFGLNLLTDGQTVFGGGMVFLAVLMVALPQYLTMPQDLPAIAAEKVVGGVAKDPDDEK